MVSGLDLSGGYDSISSLFSFVSIFRILRHIQLPLFRSFYLLCFSLWFIDVTAIIIICIVYYQQTELQNRHSSFFIGPFTRSYLPVTVAAPFSAHSSEAAAPMTTSSIKFQSGPYGRCRRYNFGVGARCFFSRPAPILLSDTQGVYWTDQPPWSPL